MSGVQAAVGVSSASDPLQAAREAVQSALSSTSLERPEVVVVFASGSPGRAAGALLAAVAAQTGGAARVVGASGAGVLWAEGELEGDAVGVALLWGVAARVAVAGGLAQDSDGACAQVLRDLDLTENGALFLLFDAMRVMPSVTAALRRQVPLSVPVVGAGVVSREGGAPWVAGTAEAPQADAVAGLWLSAVSAQWVSAPVGLPISGPLSVTQAQGGVIDRLEGRSALEVLREAVPGPLMTDLARLGQSVFVGLSGPGGVEVLRPLLGVDPYVGALAIGGAPARPGMTIRFLLRSPDAARQNLQAALEALRSKLPSDPAFLLVARAAGRGEALYGALAGIEAALIAGAFPGVPMLGVMGGCELTPAAEGFALHLYTTTIMALSSRGG